ncbi:c-type cytochrome [Sandaracinus amylolyticus]|uniref:c-type cytochrome n=1 Tax=Sandaracinus amylolyticus TaxID=927083 RepID=UPI0012ECBC9F|nr:cytochrome c [Sandaracinus amylolyticus]
MRKLGWWTAGGLATLLAGCPGPGPDGDPTPFPDPVDGGPAISSLFMDPRVESRAPQLLADTPPPISGGTLHVLRSARIAVVADPDRDRILVVDLTARQILGQTEHLPPGAEPSRIAEDAEGRVHVVLRGTGEIYSFDPERVDEGTRRAVCAMPRGLAYDGVNDQIHVACRGGELVTLPPEGGAAIRTVQLDQDLRDVVVHGDRVFVSRFRAAELLEVDDAGALVGSPLRPWASSALGGGFVEPGFMDPVPGTAGEGRFDPAVAWRTISAPAQTAPDGSAAPDDIAMVHQRASGQEVQPEPGGYGGGGRCESSIVHSSVSFFDPETGNVTQGPDLARATLPVDIAMSPRLASGAEYVAVVAAGNESGESVFIYNRVNLEFTAPGQCVFPEILTEPVPNATAAAWTDDGTLVVLSRDAIDGSGAQLALISPTEGRTQRIALGGASTYDTGHAVFHANSGGHIACASCHPEGQEDGRIWTFGNIGARRTPAMHGDLRGTEPFHWDGDMTDLNHLTHEVFTGRMQGPALRTVQVDALGHWLDELPRPVNSTPTDVAAVERGRELFYGAAQCGTCHSGALLTNNATVDVGTGGAFQVPSLVGVQYRTPVMHSGCALTLTGRFDEACGGGDRHGRTSDLSEAQIADMVAFMRTL